MKTLYFECNMGAAGDMLMASLLELHDDPNGFIDKLNNIGIPNVRVTAKPSVKHGITGTNVNVKINGREETPDMHAHNHDHENHNHESHNHESHNHAHEHNSHAHEHPQNSYHNIEQLINSLNISDTVKKNALGIYKLIADAESHVHGVPVTQIHFHEVGEKDAVADIVGVCMLIEELAPDVIISSPIHVGSGQVRCAHGTLPVPAPATAYILRDAPMYGGDIRGELCTPTGAAILKHFASSFVPMPIMKVSKIGYGMGKKDFVNINCVRAYIGSKDGIDGINEEVTELICNLDDMTPEAVAYAQQLMLDAGALDVYITPIVMKKGRMGSQFTCMCRIEDKDKMLPLIFKHTTTLGIREYICCRYTLTREQSEIQTKYGPVKIKTSQGYGTKKSKPEYNNIADIARKNNITIQEVLNEIVK